MATGDSHARQNCTLSTINSPDVELVAECDCNLMAYECLPGWISLIISTLFPGSVVYCWLELILSFAEVTRLHLSEREDCEMGIFGIVAWAVLASYRPDRNGSHKSNGILAIKASPNTRSHTCEVIFSKIRLHRDEIFVNEAKYGDWTLESGHKIRVMAREAKSHRIHQSDTCHDVSPL